MKCMNCAGNLIPFRALCQEPANSKRSKFNVGRRKSPGGEDGQQQQQQQQLPPLEEENGFTVGFVLGFANSSWLGSLLEAEYKGWKERRTEPTTWLMEETAAAEAAMEAAGNGTAFDSRIFLVSGWKDNSVRATEVYRVREEEETTTDFPYNFQSIFLRSRPASR